MINILSIIVARKGSKGLPSKCMLPINNKPVVEHVIEWSVALNRQSDLINIQTLVSTDIDELRGVCQKNGAVYIPRDETLAGDEVRIEDVMLHAAEKMDGSWDYICLQYGNIPIRYDHLFLDAVDFMEENPEYDAVLSFQNVEKFNPAWMVTLAQDELPPWEEKGFRRQDLTAYMVHDGHTCISRYGYFSEAVSRLKKSRKGQMYEFFGETIKPWVHGKLVIDIDSERDYWLAKAVMGSDSFDQLVNDEPSGNI